MKGSLIVVGIFIIGCIAGWTGLVDLRQWGTVGNDIAMYILYVLMFLVGVSLGCNPDLKNIIKSIRPRILLVPLATIVGTLSFSAAASFLLAKWNVFDCMAVGSGFGYYSLSSVLISEYKEATAGVQLAAELATVALMTNVFREITTLTCTPLIAKWFGPLAPITSAGVTSIDVALPVILKASGDRVLPIAIINGVLTDVSVPIFVSFFCSF